MFKLNQKSNICKYERFSEQSLLSLMHKCLQQVFGVLSDNPPIYHYWFDGENQSIILPLERVVKSNYGFSLGFIERSFCPG